MRAWIEVPAGWGRGPVQVLKGWLARARYATEEYRVAGHVMLAVTGGRPALGVPWACPGHAPGTPRARPGHAPGTPRAWPPDWRGRPGPAP